eukprot:CAMPEP_0168855198 /NCGR_PEP_ID=MMETSP0727-20121128/14511_1 /TAXON_ID=265536 /ORGANISM="Amphiprora sp., Strain CCMP467" /LENGTH=44 /DNA_ID= /DNA_START= /DNA_END= /DNA_ORIENTATION=
MKEPRYTGALQLTHWSYYYFSLAYSFILAVDGQQMTLTSDDLED